MIIPVEIGFYFMFGVEDFAFKGIEAKQAFQSVVGERGFADRQTAG